MVDCWAALSEGFRGMQGPGKGQGPKYIVVVYKVLSIYRFLPGFREIAGFWMNLRLNKFNIDIPD